MLLHHLSVLEFFELDVLVEDVHVFFDLVLGRDFGLDPFRADYFVEGETH